MLKEGFKTQVTKFSRRTPYQLMASVNVWQNYCKKRKHRIVYSQLTDMNRLSLCGYNMSTNIMKEKRSDLMTLWKIKVGHVIY